MVIFSLGFALGLCIFNMAHTTLHTVASLHPRTVLPGGLRPPQPPPPPPPPAPMAAGGVGGAAPRRLRRDEHGVAFYVQTPCQNSSITFADLTVYVVSSAATYAKRFPAIERTWVAELERRGATVAVFVGPGDGNFTDPRVVRVPRDVGPVMCVQRPPEHCDALFHEHAEWLRDNVRTALVSHVDDDTVVHPDRFLEVLRCLPDPRAPDAELWMLGDCHKAGWEARAFCGGGAGYTFPATLLPWFARCASGAGRADDVQASWCALDGNATLVNHPSFHYAAISPHGWVSAHHVPPERVEQFWD